MTFKHGMGKQTEAVNKVKETIDVLRANKELGEELKQVKERLEQLSDARKEQKEGQKRETAPTPPVQVGPPLPPMVSPIDVVPNDFDPVREFEKVIRKIDRWLGY
jgi:hypothetical protein